MFSEVVNFKTAKILNNQIYGYDKYALEDEVEVSWDNYLGRGKYHMGDLIDDGDYIHGKYVMAPTVAEVLDWLLEEKQIVVNIAPAFSLSTKNNVSYYVIAYEIDKGNECLNVVIPETVFVKNIKEAVETIVEKVLKNDGTDNQ